MYLYVQVMNFFESESFGYNFAKSCHLEMDTMFMNMTGFYLINRIIVFMCSISGVHNPLAADWYWSAAC